MAAQDSWQIGLQDVRDWEGFLRALKDPSNAFSVHLCGSLPKRTRALLTAYGGAGVPRMELQSALLNGLNRLLKGASLYTPQRFRRVALTKTTRAMVAGNPAKHDATRLNRMLISEVYYKWVSSGMPTGSREWHKFQIEKYETEYPRYVAFAAALRRVLEGLAKKEAPMGIVQVRPKGVSSFAEKAMRKAFKYDRPVCQITDLCGGRVIVSTQEEFDAVCEFIRGARCFVIDEANTVDARTRLGTGEFGYGAYHYVVQVRPDGPFSDDEAREIGDRKAEIQARTFLQHGWASVTHDTSYKEKFRFPESLKRQQSRAAALLEEVDAAFSRVHQSLEAYQSNYGAYMVQKDREREIEVLEMVLENEPEAANKPATALRIAQIAKAGWDWPAIVDQLEPYVAIRCREQPEILTEHGHALCQMNRDAKDKTSCEAYARGYKELEKAARDGQRKARVRALTYLGWSLGNMPDACAKALGIRSKESRAREQYQKAFEADPSNPYILADYLGYSIYVERTRDFARQMRPALERAIENCRAHVEAGTELPWAFLAMGKFHLLLEEFSDNGGHQSLASYAKAVHLCVAEESCVPEEVLEEERIFLRRINFGNELPPRHQWIDDLLLLARCVRFRTDVALAELDGRRLRGKAESKKPRFLRPVVIVVGGAHPEISDEMESYREPLTRAFEGFTGTIVGGGTSVGIPGIVGELAGKLKKQMGDTVEVTGYLPSFLPADAPRDDRYHRLLITEGSDFTPGQLLQTWIDLVSGGVEPSEVMVLGINGGEMSAVEYRLALALGAIVGVIESSGRAVAELLPDADWWNAPNLLWLPCDPMAMKALVNRGSSELDKRKLETMGAAIHARFLEENRWSTTDPAMLPWELLRPDLKGSNLEQAAYIEEALRRNGYDIQAVKGKPRRIKFSNDEIEAMAEMEHGRWVIERLRSGWRYGSKRDAAAKKNPCLVAWKDLPESAKQWDRDAVRAWPEILAEVGLEVCRQRRMRRSS